MASSQSTVSLHSGEVVRGKVRSFDSAGQHDVAFSDVTFISGRTRTSFLIHERGERAFAEVLRDIANELDTIFGARVLAQAASDRP